MKPSELLNEILYPLQNVAIVFAMIFYWLLFNLAKFAGFFGIALLVLTVPAYFRFLLSLLENRANERSPPVPDITMFNPADNAWSLTPLVLLAVLIWANVLLQNAGFVLLAKLFELAVLVIAPASRAVLAITHSPGESLNPLAIARMIKACGVNYVVVPLVLVAMSVIFRLLADSGTGMSLLGLGTSYQVVLMFSLTGAVLHASGVAAQVEIPAALEKTADEIAGNLDKKRQSVATHAYGFVSRGNREGGLNHIRQWVAAETDQSEAYQWFFRTMLKWEQKEAALFFAQDYFAYLARSNCEQEALKLIAQCQHQDAQWLPASADRDYACELTERFGRDDLRRGLKGRPE